MEKRVDTGEIFLCCPGTMATGEEPDFVLIEQLLGVETADHAKTGLPEMDFWAVLKRGERKVGKLRFRSNADLDMHTTDMVRWLSQREGDLTDLGLGEGKEINLSAFREQAWSFCAVERSGLLRLVQQVWEHNMARLTPLSPSSSEDGSNSSSESEPGSDGTDSESGSDGGDPEGGSSELPFLDELVRLIAAQRAALWVIARNIAFQFQVEDGVLGWDKEGKKSNSIREDFLDNVRQWLSGDLEMIQSQGELRAFVVDDGTTDWIRNGHPSFVRKVQDPQQRRMLVLTLAAAYVVRGWSEDAFVENGTACCSTKKKPLRLGTLVETLKIQDLLEDGGQKEVLEACKKVLFGSQPEDEFGASGSGLHGGTSPDGSSEESEEPEWLTRHKETFLKMGEEERAKTYGTALAAAGSTVAKHIDAKTLRLRPENMHLWGEPVKPFYERLRAFLKNVFPGGFSEAISRTEFSDGSTNERCLITNYTGSEDGPVQVRQLAPGKRGDIVLKRENQDLLFQEDSMITTETDPFFDYMAWSQERKESEWFHGGQLGWHLVVMATVFVLLELGDEFDPRQVIDPAVLEGVQTIIISRDEEDSPRDSPLPVTPKKTPEERKGQGNFSPGEEEEDGGVRGWRCSVM